jgi:menaquinol-cytochrome c reductase iron-sulfur subunit
MNLTRKLLNRETFVALLLAGVGGVASVIYGIPIIGGVLSALFVEPKDVWRDVGAVDKFKIGDTTQVVFQYPFADTITWSGSTANTASWLRRTGQDSFIAFAVYCTHLGCPVHWLADPKIFLCPCHGSVFNADGTVAGGPAPRPLFNYDVRVRNGRVEIKTTHQPVVAPIFGG